MRDLQTELEKLKTSESYLKLQIASDSEELARRSARVEYLERESREQRAAHEERVCKFQAQAKEHERDMRAAKERVMQLQNLMESGNVQSKLLAASEAQAKMRDLEAAVAAYKEEVPLLRAFKEESSSKVKELQQENSRLSNQVLEGQIYSQQVNELKLLVEDNLSMINRLRQEALLSEQNHALKTAQLAAAEQRIENTARELEIKESTTREALERVTVLQTRLSSAEFRLQERVKELTARIDELRGKEDEVKAAYEKDIAALREKHELHVESIQRENAKKSSTARLLLSEREEEIRVAQDKIRELQTEIASGGPTERRIFELATVQAKRDAVHNLHV